MEIYWIIAAVSLGIAGLWWSYTYMRGGVSRRYVVLDNTLSVPSGQPLSGPKLMASLFIDVQFLDTDVRSLVLKQVKIQDPHYQVGKFEQLVFSADMQSHLSVSCYVSRAAYASHTSHSTRVTYQGVMYLKGGRKRPFYCKKSLQTRGASAVSLT